MKEICIRLVYDVSHQVMNVGENGTKTHYDPVFKQNYAYGSAQNIKRNVKELFKEYSNIKSPNVYFEKECDPKNTNENGTIQEKQLGVATEIDISNPFCALFGAWNATSQTYEKKYSKAAISAAIRFSEFKPLHSLLSYLKTNEFGVYRGDENSKIAVISKDRKNDSNRYYSAEELAKGINIPLEKANDFFNNCKKINAFKENKTANGIYYVDVFINIDDAIRYCLTDNPITEEEKQDLINRGMILKIVKNKEYLYYPKDFSKKYIEYLVYSIFNWSFTSNVSLHASKPELLRVAIADENKTMTTLSMWHQSTFAKVSSEDNTKAEMCFYDNLEDYGVYTYNTLLLNKYMPTDNISIYAVANASKKVLELCYSYIDEM